MQPKTEKRPYLAGFLIKHKHIAWSDKRYTGEMHRDAEQVTVGDG
jgi:hypothetical protein